jgi:hypothetical protein
MNIDGCIVMIDTASVFFNFFRIEGCFHAPDDRLTGVSILGGNTLATRIEINRPHPGVEAALGPDKGFCVQVLLDDQRDQFQLLVQFEMASGKTIMAPVIDLCAEREAAYAGRNLLHRFLEMVNRDDQTRILDIGGRARSGLDRSQLFKGKCTVLDVIAGDNVDVVGDAHMMSQLFPPGSFDAMFSSSVFEHLLMPWTVAAEMSRVLAMGGIAFIATHQTIGMHDRPWDFWRFSDTAWDALFNRLTGFEILDRALENPQFIIPHFLNASRGQGLEAAAGYVGSSVLVRKIGEPTVNWPPIRVSELIETSYPETTEQALPDFTRKKARRFFNFSRKN